MPKGDDMGGRGSSSAGIRGFLNEQGRSLVFVLQDSSKTGDFEEAWSNFISGRGYPTAQASANRKQYNERKARTKAALGKYIGEHGMTVEDAKAAIKKVWS